MKIGEEINDKQDMAHSLTNIGFIYQNQAESSDNNRVSDSLLNKSLDYYHKSLKIWEKLGAKRGISSSLCHIGAVYFKQSASLLTSSNLSEGEGLLQKAMFYVQRSLAVSRELGFPENIRDAADILLNEIVNEKQIYQPGDILNHLNDGIVQALHQESRSQDDGMDISICLFDKEKNKITFAGANHSLYVVQNNSIEEIKGDIYSIGSMFGNKFFSFAQQEIALSKNSSIYFSTDGFADQVGGATGKKFLVKQLEKLLFGISSLEIKDQKEEIKKAFEEWKGNYAQLDDLLVVGIKI